MQQVMIVTGGSQGIGEAVARLAAARGYAVALTYQSNQALATQWSPISGRRRNGHRGAGGDGRRGFDPGAVPNGR